MEWSGSGQEPTLLPRWEEVARRESSDRLADAVLYARKPEWDSISFVMKFRLGLAGESNVCSHCYSVPYMKIPANNQVILLKLYVPFHAKKEKMECFMCLLEFECSEKLKVHNKAIPGPDDVIYTLVVTSSFFTRKYNWKWSKPTTTFDCLQLNKRIHTYWPEYQMNLNTRGVWSSEDMTLCCQCHLTIISSECWFNCHPCRVWILFLLSYNTVPLWHGQFSKIFLQKASP